MKNVVKTSTIAILSLAIVAIAIFVSAMSIGRPTLTLDKRIVSKGESVRATLRWQGPVRFAMLVWDGPVAGSAIRQIDDDDRTQYVFDRELVRLPSGDYVVQGLVGYDEDEMYASSLLTITVVGGEF